MEREGRLGCREVCNGSLEYGFDKAVSWVSRFSSRSFRLFMIDVASRLTVFFLRGGSSDGTACFSALTFPLLKAILHPRRRVQKIGSNPTKNDLRITNGHLNSLSLFYFEAYMVLE